MIGRLRGIILNKQPPQLIVEANGVGYELEAPMSTFYQLPENNQEVILHTHMVVRDDAHLLYGFYQLPERELFRSLIKVNGIGPKAALAILSSMTPTTFATYITEGDSSALVKIPGIGKKTAERLIIEMRDKFKTNQSLSTITNNDIAIQQIASCPKQEAISALVNLGYKQPDAIQAIAAIHEDGLSVEEMIRFALQLMIKGKRNATSANTRTSENN